MATLGWAAVLRKHEVMQLMLQYSSLLQMSVN